MAGVKLTRQNTDYHGHATAMAQDIGAYDAIITIGGDGTLHGALTCAAF